MLQRDVPSTTFVSSIFVAQFKNLELIAVEQGQTRAERARLPRGHRRTLASTTRINLLDAARPKAARGPRAPDPHCLAPSAHRATALAAGPYGAPTTVADRAGSLLPRPCPEREGKCYLSHL
jgi:hypothetical protein